MAKHYLSNIRLAWTFERQEALLDAKAPGWRKEAVYRDTLSTAKRKAHGKSDLVERAYMLKSSTRSDGGEVRVPSLAVLDWSVKGLLGVFAELSAKNATLVSLECGTRVPPNNMAAAGVAVAAFEKAIRRIGDAKKTGGMVSGERRSAVSKAATDQLKLFWCLPSEDYPTESLLERFKVSRPTAILYCGKRADAQRIHAAGQKTAESNRRRRKNVAT